MLNAYRWMFRLRGHVVLKQETLISNADIGVVWWLCRYKWSLDTIPPKQGDATTGSLEMHLPYIQTIDSTVFLLKSSSAYLQENLLNTGVTTRSNYNIISILPHWWMFLFLHLPSILEIWNIFIPMFINYVHTIPHLWLLHNSNWIL